MFQIATPWLHAGNRDSSQESQVAAALLTLTIMTRNGSLMPSVFCGSAGHTMNVVLTFELMISSTDDWISSSVMRLMCPLCTAQRSNAAASASPAACPPSSVVYLCPCLLIENNHLQHFLAHIPSLSQICRGLLPME